MEDSNQQKPVTKELHPVSWLCIDGEEFYLNSTSAARFFAVTPKTLSAWAKRGAPKEERGWWDIKALMLWKYGLENIEMSSEARKTLADAEFREIKVKKEQIALDLLEGRLIEREEVDKTWTVIGAQIKNNLLMWAKSLTPHLAHQDMRNVESTLTRSVYDLLEQLSGKGKYNSKKAKH